MAKAYYILQYGNLIGITITGKTDPGIKKNMPHGPGSDTGSGSKSPGAPSVVTGK